MKPAPRPSDRIEPGRALKLSDHDKARLIQMRQQTGAVEISIRVYVRPGGNESKPFVRLQSATRSVTVHSALNAEQIIVGGPAAGLHFTATEALLELYEEQHGKNRNRSHS